MIIIRFRKNGQIIKVDNHKFVPFTDERDKFVVIYLNDLTIFSKSDEDHLIHLKQTFEKCRKFGLSLNPKNSHFAMQEGKLLGHIVSQDGIKIDPKRVEAIDTINIPRNVKYIQSFLGKIFFLGDLSQTLLKS